MIFNPLETLYDEQAPLREVRHILHRILAALQKMKQQGVSLLIASMDRTVWPEERNNLYPTLASAMDRVYHLNDDLQHHYSVQLEEFPSAPSASLKTLKGGKTYGTHRTDIHQHHRQ